MIKLDVTNETRVMLALALASTPWRGPRSSLYAIDDAFSAFELDELASRIHQRDGGVWFDSSGFNLGGPFVADVAPAVAAVLLEFLPGAAVLPALNRTKVRFLRALERAVADATKGEVPPPPAAPMDDTAPVDVKGSDA